MNILRLLKEKCFGPEPAVRVIDDPDWGKLTVIDLQRTHSLTEIDGKVALNPGGPETTIAVLVAQDVDASLTLAKQAWFEFRGRSKEVRALAMELIPPELGPDFDLPGIDLQPTRLDTVLGRVRLDRLTIDVRDANKPAVSFSYWGIAPNHWYDFTIQDWKIVDGGWSG